MILSISLFVIFIILSGFHFYWLFGGEWGVENVIPTNTDNETSLSTPKLATLIVALGLGTFGLMYLLKSGLVEFEIPHWLYYGYWIIPSIFILRGIGEFKYVGFFKKVKDTKFAKSDTQFFTPLCFIIGVLGVLIQF
ncbi:DUF3995 domain-containing protein [Flammeovirga pacifica]|uniref:DUF3995 domain-containing protein n=1 Tax=Flammeovirga pacifica TaxID=915059 RepID=A0A1S1Z3R5_FLAPC|nr:DUF3995 domain-containing protein [Flammeovirga pacifica]OHX67867.1 hypothetical protein NH26_16745 [Flammeovirga pacifica]